MQPKEKELKNNFEPLEQLIQAMKIDPLINAEVIKMLRLSPYQRRSVLNNWLEKLENRQASQNLRIALSYLFDDMIVFELLKLIKKKF
jgi:hypothetical protein